MSIRDYISIVLSVNYREWLCSDVVKMHAININTKEIKEMTVSQIKKKFLYFTVPGSSTELSLSLFFLLSLYTYI